MKINQNLRVKCVNNSNLVKKNTRVCRSWYYQPKFAEILNFIRLTQLSNNWKVIFRSLLDHLLNSMYVWSASIHVLLWKFTSSFFWNCLWFHLLTVSIFIWLFIKSAKLKSFYVFYLNFNRKQSFYGYIEIKFFFLGQFFA